MGKFGRFKGRRRRGSRKKRTRSRKTARVSRRRLADKKINSLFEKRAKEIAIAEDRKNETRLVLRKQWFGTYDMPTNTFGAGVLLDFTGLCTPLSDIIKSDIEFLQNVPAVDNPMSVAGPSGLGDESGPIGQGVGRGMLNVTKHGTRSSEFIQFRSISLNVRARVRAVADGQTPGSFDGCWVHYAIVSVRDKRNILIQDPNNPPMPWAPEPQEVLPLKRFSYERALDHDEAANTADLKYKTLLRGKMFLRHRKDRCDVKFAERHIKYTGKIKYDEALQNGESVVDGRKLFLVFRSDIPAAQGFDQWKPEIVASTRVRYVDC